MTSPTSSVSNRILVIGPYPCNWAVTLNHHSYTSLDDHITDGPWAFPQLQINSYIVQKPKYGPWAHRAAAVDYEVLDKSFQRMRID